MRKWWFIPAVAFTILNAVPAPAAPVVFALSGSITQSTGVAGGLISPGESWTGWLTYDTDTPRYSNGNFRGDVSIAIGGLTYWTDPLETVFQTPSPQDLAVNDMFGNGEGTALGGSYPSDLLLGLVFAGDVFTDFARLPTAIDSSAFSSGWMSLRFSQDGTQRSPSTGGVAARIDRFVQVAEPRASLLFGVGVGVVLGLARLRQAAGNLNRRSVLVRKARGE